MVKDKRRKTAPTSSMKVSLARTMTGTVSARKSLRASKVGRSVGIRAQHWGHSQRFGLELIL